MRLPVSLTKGERQYSYAKKYMDSAVFATFSISCGFKVFSATHKTRDRIFSGPNASAQALHPQP